ncbi:MAG TPA: Hsp70 family protein [Bryobacteraceae bacterium]|nr:Hsp70 family protein [Bryobacteraceae bacterium]
MKLGVDFGTTRVVVAAADRGNFPLVVFENGEESAEWFPPLVALRAAENVGVAEGLPCDRRYGWPAWNVQAERGWTVVRSLKRYLEDAGPETHLEAGGVSVLLAGLLEGLMLALKRELAEQYGAKEAFEVMLGVPAHANSNQRFMTVEAFRRAGFIVLGVLNEPSAASIEFGHRGQVTGRVLVYDLGGGTFDVSLVDMGVNTHTVVATEGIPWLGGDEFDLILAEMAVGDAALAGMDAGELFRLQEECRRHKEALHPNSRRMVIDLDSVREGLGQVTIMAADYYEQCRPLVDRTVEATARLAALGPIDSLYVTGGGSELPLVARVLREQFGRKVKRSEYTRSATAIGLAIQADAATGYTLREVFTRNFGVWREGEGGQRMLFDSIFPAGTRLPAVGDEPLTVTRTYYPVHNIGDFRYIEASHVDAQGDPTGDITVWDEILFPFDPALAEVKALEGVPVERGPGEGQQIEERYSCDSTGIVTVTIRNLSSHYGRQYQLGRWSGKSKVVKPAARKRSRGAS